MISHEDCVHLSATHSYLSIYLSIYRSIDRSLSLLYIYCTYHRARAPLYGMTSCAFSYARKMTALVGNARTIAVPNPRKKPLKPSRASLR